MKLKYMLSFDQHNKLNEGLISEAADEKVRAVQAALKAKGGEYASLLGTTGPNGDGVDGVYGANTKAAIKKFQADNGIQQTGFAGPLTSKALGVQPMSNQKTKVTTTKAPDDYDPLNDPQLARIKPPNQTPQVPAGKPAAKTTSSTQPASAIPPLDFSPKPQVAIADTFEPYANQQAMLKQRTEALMKEIRPELTKVNQTNQVKVTEPEFRAATEHGSWLSKFVKGSMKALPLHIRAMIYYLGGRKAPMQSDELTPEEQKYLYEVALKYGKKGFDYPVWKSIGAAGMPTAITSQGIQAEAAKLKQAGTAQLASLVSPNLAGQFMYTLGAISPGGIVKSGNTITVKDNYDMNVVEGGQTREDVFKGIGQAFKLWTAGEASLYSLFRKTIALRELFGYKGYPIQFVLNAPAPAPTTPVQKTAE